MSTEDLLKLYDMFDKQDRLIDNLLKSVDQLTATVVALTSAAYPEGDEPTEALDVPRFLGEGEGS